MFESLARHVREIPKTQRNGQTAFWAPQEEGHVCNILKAPIGRIPLDLAGGL